MQGPPGMQGVPQMYIPHAGMFAIPVMMQPQAAPQKRPLEAEEPQGAKKKARSKAKTGEGAYSRGVSRPDFSFSLLVLRREAGARLRDQEAERRRQPGCNKRCVDTV